MELFGKSNRSHTESGFEIKRKLKTPNAETFFASFEGIKSCAPTAKKRIFLGDNPLQARAFYTL